MEDEPGYQEHIEAATKNCQCCNMCWSNPCGACLAGGVCEAWRCSCLDDDWTDYSSVYRDEDG